MSKGEEEIVFTCKAILEKPHISGGELEYLLDAREKELLSFSLVDIRELYEYSDLSIKGTDLILPTSRMHLHMEEVEKLREIPFVLYCRTGNRTGQMLHIMGRMGFEQAAHLGDGIVAYHGETLRNAPPPNDI